MDFTHCFNSSSAILMEGAIAERLKREFGVVPDDKVALAGLVYHADSRAAMRTVFEEYLKIAEKYSLPFIATTPTRRANRERVGLSEYNEKIIEENVNFLMQMKKKASTDMFVGGLMGCKGDAYKATDILSVEDARAFHSWQANLFQSAKVDFLFAGIMPAITEAIGMAQAMEMTGLPYIISFMIRENGKLIDGTTIHDAIAMIDGNTSRNPIGYMTNCVHPKILFQAMTQEFNATSLVRNRFCGIQANTSQLTPDELDSCTELMATDGITLASDFKPLYEIFVPKILGGCCGTDASHIEEIAKIAK